MGSYFNRIQKTPQALRCFIEKIELLGVCDRLTLQFGNDVGEVVGTHHATAAPRHLARAIDDQRRHRAHVMVGNELRILGVVDVVTKDCHALTERRGQTIEYGVHRAARTAPSGIEIDQSRCRLGEWLFELFHIS